MFANYVNVGEIIHFYIQGWTNPITSAVTSPFTVQTYDDEGFIIDEVTTLTVQATQGILYVNQFTPTDNWKILDTPSSYTFSIST